MKSIIQGVIITVVILNTALIYAVLDYADRDVDLA